MLATNWQLAHPLLKAAAAQDGAKESGGSSIVNISSVAGLTSIKSGENDEKSYTSLTRL